MTELQAFFHMGGYAFYVWTSYGFTAALLAGVVVWSRYKNQQTRLQVFRRARKSGHQ